MLPQLAALSAEAAGGSPSALLPPQPPLSAPPAAAAAAATATATATATGSERSLLDGLLRTRQLFYTMQLNNPLLSKETVVTKLQRLQRHMLGGGAAAAAAAAGGGGGGSTSVLVLDSYNTSSSTPYCDIFNTEETWVVCAADTPLPLAGHALPPARGSAGSTRLLLACRLAWTKSIFLQSTVTSQVESALKALGEDYVRAVVAAVGEARGRAGGGALVVAPASSLLVAPSSSRGAVVAAAASAAASAAAPPPAVEVEEVGGGEEGAGSRGQWPVEARELVAALEERLLALERQAVGRKEGGGQAEEVGSRSGGLHSLTVAELGGVVGRMPAWVLLLLLLLAAVGGKVYRVLLVV